MTQASEQVHDNNYSLRAQKVLIVDGNGNATGGSGAVVGAWNTNYVVSGSTGGDIDCFEAAGTVYEIIIKAPLANEDATLVVSIDGTDVFDGNGYLQHLDGDLSVKFPAGQTCSTALTVNVTGGTSDVYVVVRYKA
jgi:hypothetical protein